MGRRAIRPRCYFGCDKPAIYPPESPRWCAVKCAAEWAAQLLDTVDADTWRPCCKRWETEVTHYCTQALLARKIARGES